MLKFTKCEQVMFFEIDLDRRERQLIVRPSRCAKYNRRVERSGRAMVSLTLNVTPSQYILLELNYCANFEFYLERDDWVFACCVCLRGFFHLTDCNEERLLFGHSISIVDRNSIRKKFCCSQMFEKEKNSLRNVK